ncbi:hypothetical protein D3C75_1098150 [compost metagenome]
MQSTDRPAQNFRRIELRGEFTGITDMNVQIKRDLIIQAGLRAGELFTDRLQARGIAVFKEEGVTPDGDCV